MQECGCLGYGNQLAGQCIVDHGLETMSGLLLIVWPLDILLESLSKRDIKLAVATATDIARTRMYLEKAGVIGYFDAIVTGDTVTNGKPEPDIYITAAQRLGLPCGECIALEDSPNGILSAYRAGCKPVMIPDLSAPDEETRAMLYGCFDSLGDFGKQLDVLL